MTEKTMTVSLRADVYERLETLAAQQKQSLEDALESLLPPLPRADGNWVRAVAEGMAALDIDWRDEPDAAERSREHYKAYLAEKAARSQASSPKTDDPHDSR